MENSAILREWFERVDTEKIGSITAIQLKTAFAIGNLEFPITVVQQMIRMCDFDLNGTMSFEEFVELNKFLLKVQHVFSDLERGRGFLVPDDVYEALIKIGFRLDSPALYTVCESFDRNKNGKFRLDDFISLCIFVQSARNLFDSFDTTKQGRVTLDLNQFIYCNMYDAPSRVCAKRRNNRKEMIPMRIDLKEALRQAVYGWSSKESFGCVYKLYQE